MSCEWNVCAASSSPFRAERDGADGGLPSDGGNETASPVLQRFWPDGRSENSTQLQSWMAPILQERCQEHQTTASAVATRSESLTKAGSVLIASEPGRLSGSSYAPGVLWRTSQSVQVPMRSRGWKRELETGLCRRPYGRPHRLKPQAPVPEDACEAPLDARAGVARGHGSTGG